MASTEGITVDVSVTEGMVHVAVLQGGETIYSEAHPTEQAIAERCAVIADRNSEHDPDRDIGAEIRAEFGIG